MTGTQALNIDSQTLDQCLKTTMNFGEFIIRNICTGQVYTIPFGGMDWVIAIGLLAAGFGLVLMFFAMAISIIKL